MADTSAFSMDLDYTREKMTLILEALAIGKGDARERVAAALGSNIVLGPTDFPPSLQADWAWIERQTTKHGPLEFQFAPQFSKSSIEHTMSRAKRATGKKIAERLYKIASELLWGKYSERRS